MLSLHINGLQLSLGIINKDIQKAHGESVIAIESLISIDASNNNLVVEVFLQHSLEISTSVGFVLSFGVVL